MKENNAESADHLRDLAREEFALPQPRMEQLDAILDAYDLESDKRLSRASFTAGWYAACAAMLRSKP